MIHCFRHLSPKSFAFVLGVPALCPQTALWNVLSLKRTNLPQLDGPFAGALNQIHQGLQNFVQVKHMGWVILRRQHKRCDYISLGSYSKDAGPGCCVKAPQKQQTLLSQRHHPSLKAAFQHLRSKTGIIKATFQM